MLPTSQWSLELPPPPPYFLDLLESVTWGNLARKLIKVLGLDLKI